MTELRRGDPTLRKILPPQKTDPAGIYVRSQFAVPCAHRGKQTWFHMLTRQMVQCEQPIPERATGEEILRVPEWSELAGGYFFAPEGKDENAFYLGLYRILHAMHRKKGVKGYTILPTTVCNARCVYCFEEGRRQETMKPETAEQVVRYIRETRRPEEIDIQWFGGEPLVAVPVIDAICAGLRKEKIPFAAMMVTNGSLITDAVADRMRDEWNIRTVQVSMDGNEADYTARKRYVRGGAVYRDVLRNIRRLAEREIRVIVRCNVDEENLPGIREFLGDLDAAVPDKRSVDVHLSLLNQVRASDREAEVWKQAAEARQLVKEYGFAAGDRWSRLRDLRNFFCMADLGSVVLTPDGSVYACESCTEESRVGSLVSAAENPGARERFLQAGQVPERCRGCAFLPECTANTFCPIRDARCREVQEILFGERVKAFFENRDRENGEPDPFEREC